MFSFTSNTTSLGFTSFNTHQSASTSAVIFPVDWSCIYPFPPGAWKLVFTALISNLDSLLSVSLHPAIAMVQSTNKNILKLSHNCINYLRFLLPLRLSYTSSSNPLAPKLNIHRMNKPRLSMTYFLGLLYPRSRK